MNYRLIVNIRMTMKITLALYLVAWCVCVEGVDVTTPAAPLQYETGVVMNTSEYFEYVDVGEVQEEEVEWCEEGCTCSDQLDVEEDCGARGRVVTPRGGTYLHLYCGGKGDVALPPRVPTVRGRRLQSLGVYDCLAPASGYGRLVRALGATDVDSLVLQRPLSSPESSLVDLHTLEALTVVSGPQWRGGPPPLPHLKKWVLRSTPIYLNESKFVGAPPIRWLEISLGTLQDIGDRSFFGLTSLERLGLYANRLSDVSVDAFEGLTSLKELDLSGNNLSSLPDGVFAKNPTLEVVAMFGNSLTSALKREWWAQDSALKNLTVSRQRGQGSPTGPWAGNLTSLQNVWAEGAGFTSLPENSFAGSPLLLTLVLNQNNLETLPEHIFRDQRNIVRIDLSHNKLSALPPQLFTSQNKLQELDLSYNQLETLPDGLFSGAVSLKQLSLRYNKLKLLATHTIVGLDSLQVLDLGHNQLHLVSTPVQQYSPLNSLTALRELDLTHNYVTDVFEDWRFVMTHLHTLNLTHNNITSLSGHDLNFLSKKVELDVRSNNISTLVLSPEDVEDEMNGGEVSVWLEHNPWRCDCRLWGLVELVRPRPLPAPSRLHLHAGGAACTSPGGLRGESLRAVSPGALHCPAPSCLANCTCTQYPAHRELRLQCNDLPINATWPDPTVMALSWTSVSLLSVPTSFPTFPDHVRNLTLRNLSLEYLPEDWTPPSQLRFLDLSDNLLTAVPASFSSLDSEVRILLAGNPLHCDCANRGELTRLFKVRRNIADWEEVVCSDGRGPEEAGSEQCGLPVGVILAAVGALIVLLVALTGALWRWRGRGAWGRWEDVEEEGEFEYDVFVSFCHADSEWVRKEIVERLEPEWRLCVHYRDWRVGDWIPAQISSSVTRSRRVLIVVSADWVHSTWARAELRVAEGERGGRGVLVLVRGEVSDLPLWSPELADLYRTRTVLSDRDPRVWSRLRAALPKPRPVIPPLVDKSKSLSLPDSTPAPAVVA